MQFEVVLSLLLSFNLCQSAPHEGFPILNPGGIGGIFKGPNSETIIKGPDGSEIVSEQEGGAVIREDNTLTSPIIVAEPELSVLQEQHVVEPIIASTVAPILTKDVAIAPIVASTSVPILSSDISLSVAEPIAPIDLKPVEIVQQDPHVIETEIIEAPDVEPLQSSDLEGPSGRIITKGSASIVSGPASTTITEPRKIILAPPKISLKTPLLVNPREESFLASLPAITASTAVSLPAVTASSTVNPLNVGIVSSVSPLNVGISTTNAPLLNANTNLNSNNIDLGGGIVNSASIPIVEYSSSNGVLSGSTLGNGISTTEAPNFVSSTITSAAPTEYVQAPYEVFPTTYQAGTGPAQSLDSQTQFIQERYEAIPSNIQGISLDNSGSSQDLAIPVEYLQAPNEPIPRNVQRISKNDNTVFTDGRIDMGDSIYKNYNTRSYQLPQVLSDALKSLYRKNTIKESDRIIIDNKMGALTENDIAYGERQDFVLPPDLSQSKYIGPVLARNGVEASQFNLEPVPLEQVSRFAGSGYSTGYRRGF